MGMKIGVPKETFPGERRVSLVPAVLPSLTKAGIEVLVESGAGVSAAYPDRVYSEKGATLVPDRDTLFSQVEIIIQVRGLGANPNAGRQDLARLRKGQVVLGLLEPLAEPQSVRDMAQTGVTAFAMELIPRITRAQTMDVLSSMATVSGYKAVLMAADTLPRMFPLLMTAAGTVSPARVFVIGAGVAGLQAIATARRLGAVVQAYDVRPAVAEQIRSLGAKFVELPLDVKDAEDKSGYAKELDESFLRRQREMMARVLAESDGVITTAAVPGKPAPKLITADMVAVMAPGSVIVDVVADRGGNCELTRPGETVVEHDVQILGPTNLPSMVPYHASQMYSKNMAAFLLHLVKKGELQLNLEDNITRETLVVRDGEVVHPAVREALGLPKLEYTEKRSE
jgi:NAD(P) transhydrogenase subunit alpha